MTRKLVIELDTDMDFLVNGGWWYEDSFPMLPKESTKAAFKRWMGSVSIEDNYNKGAQEWLNEQAKSITNDGIYCGGNWELDVYVVDSKFEAAVDNVILKLTKYHDYIVPRKDLMDFLRKYK